MTDAKAIQWYIPHGAVRLYQLLREQGDSPYEAVCNVLTALQVIMRNYPPAQTKQQRRKQKERAT
mgnify:CR=1 FL=1